MIFTFGITFLFGLVGWAFAITIVAFPNLNRGKLSKYADNSKFGKNATKNISSIAFAFFEFAFGILLFIATLLSGIVSHVQSNGRLYIGVIGSAFIADAWLNVHPYVFEGADFTGNGIVIPLMRDVGLNLINAGRVVYDTLEPESSLLGYTARDIPKQTYFILQECEINNNLPIIVNDTREFLTTLMTSFYNFVVSQGGTPESQESLTNINSNQNDLDIFNISRTLGALMSNVAPPFNCFCKSLNFISNWLNKGAFVNSNTHNALHFTGNAFIEIFRVPVNALLALFTTGFYTCNPPNNFECLKNRPPKLTKFINYTETALNYTMKIVDDITNEIFATLFNDIFQIPPTHNVIAGFGGAFLRYVNTTLDVIFHIDLVFTDNYIKAVNYNLLHDDINKGCDGIDVFFSGFNLDVFTNLGCTGSNFVRFFNEAARFIILTWQKLVAEGVVPMLTFAENYDFTNLVLAKKTAGQLCLLHFLEDINKPLGDYWYFNYKYSSDVMFAIIKWIISFVGWLVNHATLVFDYQNPHFDLNAKYISLGNIFRQFDPLCVSATTGQLPNPFNQTDAMPTQPSFFCCLGNFLEVYNERMESLLFMIIETVSALVTSNFIIIITGPNPTFDMQKKVMTLIDEENLAICCAIATLIAEANSGQCFSKEFDGNAESVYQNICTAALNFTIMPYRFMTIFNTAFKRMLEEGPSTTLVCYYIVSTYDLTFGVLIDIGYRTLRLFGCLFSIGSLDFATTIWGIFGWDYSIGFNIRQFLCQIVTDIIGVIQFLISLINNGIFNTIATYFQGVFNQISLAIQNAYNQAIAFAINIVNNINTFLQDIFVKDLKCVVNEVGVFVGSLKTCINNIGEFFNDVGLCFVSTLCACACGDNCASCTALEHFSFSNCDSLSFSNTCIFKKRDTADPEMTPTEKILLILPYIIKNITEETYPKPCLQILYEMQNLNKLNYSRYGLLSLLKDHAGACTESFQTSLYVNIFLAPSILFLLNSTTYGPNAGYVSFDPLFIANVANLIKQAKQFIKFSFLFWNFQWNQLAMGKWNHSLSMIMVSQDWAEYMEQTCDAASNTTLNFFCPLDVGYVRLGVMLNLIGQRLFVTAQVFFQIFHPGLSIFNSLLESGSTFVSSFLNETNKRGLVFPNTINKINVSIEDHSIVQRLYHVFYGAPRPKVNEQIDAMWNRFYVWWNATKLNVTNSMSEKLKPSEQAIQNRMAIVLLADHYNKRFQWNKGLHNGTITQHFEKWRADSHDNDTYFNENEWRGYVGDYNAVANLKKRDLPSSTQIKHLFCYQNFNNCLNCEFAKRILDNFLDNLFVAAQDSKRASSVARDFEWTPYNNGFHFALTHWTYKYNKTEQDINEEKWGGIWNMCSKKHPYLFDKSRMTQQAEIREKENQTLFENLEDECYSAYMNHNPNIQFGISSNVNLNGPIVNRRANDNPINGVILKPFMSTFFANVNTLLLKIDIHNFFNNFNITILEDLTNPKTIEHYINYLYNTDNAFPGLRDCNKGFGLFISLWLSLFIIAVAIGLKVFVPASLPFTFWAGSLMQTTIFFAVIWLTLAYNHNAFYLFPAPLPVLPKCLADDIYIGYRSLLIDCVPWTGLPGVVPVKCPTNIFQPRTFPDFSRGPYFFDSGLRNFAFILHWQVPSVSKFLVEQSWVHTVLSPLSPIITTDLSFPFPRGERPPDNWFSAHNATAPNYILFSASTLFLIFLFALGVILAFLLLRFIVMLIIGMILLSIEMTMLSNVQ